MNHMSWDIELSEELIRRAVVAWTSWSMPISQRKWTCLVMQIHLPEKVALTALPGYNGAQKYSKVHGKCKVR